MRLARIVSLFSILALGLAIAAGCGKRDDMLKITFKPNQSFIIPGATYSCTGDRFKAPDFGGPYIKFGFSFENISQNSLRLLFISIKGSGSAGVGFNKTYTPDASEAQMTFAPGDRYSVASSTMGTGDDACIDPFGGFNLEGKKSGSASFLWKFQFLIKDPNDPNVEVPYSQVGVTTGRFLGD